MTSSPGAAPGSLLIRGPALVDGRIGPVAVRIEGGRIASVGQGSEEPAARVIELGPRQTLVPAAVDALCALRDWGEAHRDTVEAVTRAALAAGTTVVCDQPNTVPRINSTELVHRRLATVRERSFTDFGIGAHPPADPGELEGYRDAGALCVTFFQWDLRPWNFPRDIDDSPSTFRRCAELGLRALFFPDELAFRETALEDEGEVRALEALLRRLPPELEARIFVTLPESVERIEEVRPRLPRLSVQTAPHYLFVSREEALARIGMAAAHSPPLRPAACVRRLEEMAREGRLDILVSQHTAHRIVDKHADDPIPGEFTPKRGFASIDLAYPVSLSRLGIPTACRMFAENPARHLGLRKGLIAPGFDADLAIIEEASEARETAVHSTGGLAPDIWKVDPDRFHAMGRVTPFVGERLRYRVAGTFLRGEEAWNAETGAIRRLPVRAVR